MVNGDVLAILSTVMLALCVIFFEKASRAAGSLNINIIKLFFAFCFAMLYGLIRYGELFPTDIAADAFIWLAASGFIGFTLCDLCLFQAFIEIGSRRTMLIGTIAPAIAACLGFMFLRERLSFPSWLGIPITIAGIMLVFTHNKSGENGYHFGRRGIFLALASTLLQSIGDLLSKKGVVGLDPSQAGQVRMVFGFSGFFLLLLFSRRVKEFGLAISSGKTVFWTFLGAFFGPFLGMALLLAALQQLPVAVMATIRSTSPLLLLLPAHFIFKEKIFIRDIVGAIIAVIGVCVLLLL